jgi:hypothetical protein
MNFREWLGELHRYAHRDGRGLMNNQSLDYDRLTDDEMAEVEELYLGLQQPPSSLHGQDVVFAFTLEGEKKHRRLIRLLSKASRTGVVRQRLDPEEYDTEWENDDGQVALRRKRSPLA